MLADPSTRALYLFPTKALAQDQLAELHELTTQVNQAAADRDRRRSPTTATRRRTRGAPSARGRTSCSAIPTCCTRGSCRTIRSGRAVREPALRRRRRAARVSRRVRQPSGQRAAPAAPHLPALRVGSDLHLLVGDDCQSRASWRSVWRSGRSSSSRRAARRAARSCSCSSTRRSSTRSSGIRRSYLSEARRVAGEFLKRQLQLIVFCQSRLSTEILTTYLKDDFEGPPGTPEQVRGYRGGYLPLRRREIERGLREGQVRAVVATNALELGIDIGALDIGGHGGLSGHDRLDVAACGPRRPAAGPLGGGDGGQQRAHRSVRRAQPVVLLRRVARARARQSRTTCTSCSTT